MSNSLQVNWANNLRVLATFSVIVIHTSSVIVDNYLKISTQNWVIAVFYNALSRWAVPVFVMLTGAFVLNNYDDNFKSFLLKTFKRIVIPFLFWSLIYLFFYDGDDLFSSNVSFNQKIELIIPKIVNGTSSHLWYIYMILSLYLIIPVFSKWIRANNKKEIQFFLGTWLVLLFFQNFLKNSNSYFEFNYFTGYIGYLILGSYLFKNGKVNSKLLLAGFVIALLVTVYLTYSITVQTKKETVTFLAPLTPNICLMGICIYLLFKNSTLKLPFKFQKMIDHISKYTYGIFLIHLLFLSLIDEYLLGLNLWKPIFTIPIISFICFLFSYCSILLLRKIPYVSKLAG